MKDDIIKFSSITQAMKAKKILDKEKIKVAIDRTSGKQYGGCGYKLKTNVDTKFIKKILIKNNINFIK